MQLSQKVREYLAKTDEEFRRLYEKHQKCEEELDALSKKSGPSAEDQLHIAEVKKIKLHLKDHMFLIAKKYEKEIGDLP